MNFRVYTESTLWDENVFDNAANVVVNFVDVPISFDLEIIFAKNAVSFVRKHFRLSKIEKLVKSE